MGPSPSRRRAWALFAALHLVTAALFLFDRAPGTRAALTGLPVDDAWIHLVYARSFAHGQGFAYNPGQQETGFTSPLWVALLAPAVWLSHAGAPLVPVVKVLGLGLAWWVSVLAYELLRRLFDDARPALLAGGLVALDPWLSFAKLSGMEVHLAAATVLWALLELARGRLGWAAVAVASCGLARPENALFVAPALGWLARERLRRGDGFRGLLAAVGPTALAGGAWMAYCLAVSGRPLPNTFYAKHPGKGPGLWLENLTKLGAMLGDLPWFAFGSGALFFVLGAVLLLRRRADSPGAQRWLRVFIVAYPPVFILGLAWAHKMGDQYAFYWSRYLHPVVPLLLLPLSVGLVFSLSGAARALRGGVKPLGQAAGWVLLGLFAVVPLVAVPRALKAKADRFAWNCQNIEEMQVALGRWLAERTAPGEWIAANDAGALRFVSDRPTFDLTGLNFHQALRGDRRAILERLAPRYYVLFPAWYPSLLNRPGARVVHSARAAHYTICDCEQDELVVLQLPPPAR
ncbi:MAG TPA: hypothetical protein VK447_10870 [Myxococcaceae bacterium]|nr:hypothetical protein [Myxococcaceae bacterium]